MAASEGSLSIVRIPFSHVRAPRIRKDSNFDRNFDAAACCHGFSTCFIKLKMDNIANHAADQPTCPADCTTDGSGMCGGGGTGELLSTDIPPRSHSVTAPASRAALGT